MAAGIARELFLNFDPDEKQDQGKDAVGKDDPEKCRKRKVGKAVQVQVLRIADGRGHAAQVRRDGLEDHGGDQPVFPRAFGHLVEAVQRKGNQRDQADIVRDQHAQEKRRQDQNSDGAGDSLAARHQTPGDDREDASSAHAGDDSHKAEEKAQGPEIDVIKVLAIDRDERSREDSEDHGDGKDGFIFYKIYKALHDKYNLKFVESNHYTPYNK